MEGGLDIAALSRVTAIADKVAKAARMLNQPVLVQPLYSAFEIAVQALSVIREPDTPRQKQPAVELPPKTKTRISFYNAAERSSWDPEPAISLMEASRVRALLLELIRRAAHDWVLYRTSGRMEKREIAQNAFIWLFEEKPGHPWWSQRADEGRHLTSFLSICELLELDPAFVRHKVKQMTPQGIKMAGRPAETRKLKGVEIEHYVEHSVELVSLDDIEDHSSE